MTEKSKFKRNGLESEITESENYLFCICRGGRTVFTLGCYCRYILKSHLEKNQYGHFFSAWLLPLISGNLSLSCSD